MRIRGLIWLDEIVEKLRRKHQVEPDEVSEIFSGRPHYRFVEKGYRAEENVYAALGQTRAGRYLIVFFVYKQDGRALIISARTMMNKERRQYERR